MIMAPNKLTSKVWNYFKRNNDTSATCKLCNKCLRTSGNTTNLRGHIEKVHSLNVNVVNAVNDDVQILEENCSQPKQRKITDNITTITEGQSNIPTTSRTTEDAAKSSKKSVEAKIRQPTVGDIFESIKSVTCKDGIKSKKLTEAVVNYIILDNKPFSTVEGKGFLALMKEAVPLYKVPCRETVKSRIDDKYEAMSCIFKQILQRAENYCLTYDIWTETMTNKSFLGITVHYMENFELLSGTFGVIELFESHTAEYLERELSKVMSDWGITVEKVTAVVTDNDSSMMKLIRSMFGENHSMFCTHNQFDCNQVHRRVY